MMLRLPDAGDITRVVREAFGVRIESAVPVVGGWDENAAVWEALDDDGRRWCVKSSRRDITFGLSVASALVDDGVPGVVAPERTLDRRPWAEETGTIVTLSPWIEGVDASDAGSAVVDWSAFGRTLRSVHDHVAPRRPRPVRRGIRRSLLTPSDLATGLDRRFDDGRRVGDGPDADGASDRLRARWTDARGRVDALVTAERLLKRRRTATTRVTLHGDPHLGNVVVDADGAPWLVDFDESTVAPREVDLMLVELGVLSSVPISDDQRRAFRSGYGEDAPVDEERLVRFGAVRAVEDLVWTLHRALDRDDRAPVDADEALDGMLGPDGQIAMVERALDRLDPPTPRTTIKELR